MLDFILPISDSENEYEALHVSTRSKGPVNPIQPIKIQKPSTSTTKNKVVKKSTSTSPQVIPFSSNSPSSPRTLVVSDTIGYNIVEDMKKIEENISIHELTKLKQQQKFLPKELNAVPTSPLPIVVVSKSSNGMGKPPGHSLFNSSNIILIGDKSNSHIPPFLLTFEIFNKNVHNCLVDSGGFFEYHVIFSLSEIKYFTP